MGIDFEPGVTGFSIQNAYFLANASQDAYASDKDLAASIADLGMGDAVQPFHNDHTDTHGFLGRTDQVTVLAFRGTGIDSLKNWLTDDRIQQVGGIHQGFSEAIESVWGDIRGLLPDPPGPQNLWITGHSLGGALATLAARRLLQEGFTVQAAYTFGSPRVGDPDFATAYQPVLFRVENALDIVPHVPLEEPPLDLFPRYQSAGTLKYLASAGGLQDEGPSDLEVIRRAFVPHLPFPLFNPFDLLAQAEGMDQFFEKLIQLLPEGIADHLPTRYIAALDTLRQST